MVKVSRYAIETSAGPMLEMNEDDVDVDVINNLFFVLDGFGGVSSGNSAVKNIKELIKKFYTRVNGDPDSTLPFFFAHKYLIEGNAIVNALNYAHALVCKENSKVDMNSRGGASVIAGAFAENIMTFVSSGNCIAYIYRKGNIEAINRPDTMMGIKQDSFTYEGGTAPLSGIGIFDQLQLVITERRIMSGDVIIMLSDGVYSRVKKNELKYVLENSEIHFNDMGKELFKMANSRGNLDNQTALFVQF